MGTIAAPHGFFAKWQALKANNFARNLGSMGSAQLAIRFSRLAATILLSRLLLPQDYGIAALVLTVYEFISLFTRNGISAKVVQASVEDLPVVAMTAYHMTWVLCLGLMVVQLLVAVPVALFYDNMSLALPIAAMSLIYLASPLSNIQSAFQQREGRLGRIALAGAVQVVVDNILTAIFAVSGFGLWAIILPKILVAPIWIGFVRFGHSWRPKKIAGVSRFHGWQDIARFSRNVMGVELLTTFQANVDNLLVGYFLGLHALGIYYFAFNGGLGITLGLISASDVAVYPHLCQVRDNPAALADRFAKTRRTISFTVLPLIIAQVALAPIYVPIVFGQKWVEAVPVLMLICLSAIMRPFASLCSQLLKALGRPGIELKWQLGNTALLMVALVIGAQFNILAVAAAVFVVQSLVLGAFAYFIPRQVLSVALPMSDGESIEVVEDERKFAALETEWDALWLRVPGAYASQSFAYCKTAWRQKSRAKLHIYTLRRAGKLVMVWPMLETRKNGVRNLCALNSGATEYDSVLVDPDESAAELYAAAMNWIAKKGKADRLDVPFVNEGSARQAALQTTKFHKRAHKLASPLLDFSAFADFDSYWKSLKSSLRTGTSRRRRRLEELGAVEVKLDTSGAERIEAIDWALAQKVEWMRRKKMENDFITRPAFRDFLVDYGNLKKPEAHLCVMTMRHNGKLIACKIGMIDRVRFEGWITVYDPAFEQFSPGVLLLVDCFKWCVETGRLYDFRIGDESYKMNWANGSANRISYKLALTMKGRFAMVFETLSVEAAKWMGRAFKASWMIFIEPRTVIRKLSGSIELAKFSPGSEVET